MPNDTLPLDPLLIISDEHDYGYNEAEYEHMGLYAVMLRDSSTNSAQKTFLVSLEEFRAIRYYHRIGHVNAEAMFNYIYYGAQIAPEATTYEALIDAALTRNLGGQYDLAYQPVQKSLFFSQYEILCRMERRSAHELSERRKSASRPSPESPTNSTCI